MPKHSVLVLLELLESGTVRRRLVLLAIVQITITITTITITTMTTTTIQKQ